MNRRSEQGNFQSIYNRISISYHPNISFFISNSMPDADRFRTAIMACVRSSITPHSSTTIQQLRRIKFAARQMTFAMHPIGPMMALFAWGISKRLTLKQQISTRRTSIATQPETRHTHHSPIQLINIPFSLYVFICFALQ